jgi:hypothetical protein
MFTKSKWKLTENNTNSINTVQATVQLPFSTLFASSKRSGIENQEQTSLRKASSNRPLPAKDYKENWKN